MKKLGSIFPLITLALLGVVEIARCQSAPPPVNAYTQSVSREVLASDYPSDAQGRILELVRYTIPSAANFHFIFIQECRSSELSLAR